MRKPTLVKLGVGAAAIVVLPWLFLKTARDTIAAPYAVDDATLTGWRLVLTDPGQPGIAVLGLQPPPSLAPGLFDQVFKRTMESMISPGADILPIVLQGEFQSGLRAVLAPDELLQAARDAGLEAARLEPVCRGTIRLAQTGRFEPRACGKMKDNKNRRKRSFHRLPPVYATGRKPTGRRKFRTT